MISRRELIKLGSGALAAVPLSRAIPSVAQTPKRGGTLVVRAWDPPHFDHVLTPSYKTHIPASFTHSRLLRGRAAGVTRSAPRAVTTKRGEASNAGAQ